MNKEKDEVMKNHTLAIYESTFNKLVQFKELRNWTHDRALNELIDFYEDRDTGIDWEEKD